MKNSSILAKWLNSAFQRVFLKFYFEDMAEFCLITIILSIKNLQIP